MNAAIVILIYKTELSWNERISLEQCLLIKFPKACFANIASYNDLMLNINFYRKFLEYDYIGAP